MAASAVIHPPARRVSVKTRGSAKPSASRTDEVGGPGEAVLSVENVVRYREVGRAQPVALPADVEVVVNRRTTPGRPCRRVRATRSSRPLLRIGRADEDAFPGREALVQQLVLLGHDLAGSRTGWSPACSPISRRKESRQTTASTEATPTAVDLPDAPGRQRPAASQVRGRIGPQQQSRSKAPPTAVEPGTRVAAVIGVPAVPAENAGAVAVLVAGLRSTVASRQTTQVAVSLCEALVPDVFDQGVVAPAAEERVYPVPRREVGRHGSPLDAVVDEVADLVQHRSVAVSLRCPPRPRSHPGCPHQGRRDKGVQPSDRLDCLS